MSGAWGFTAVSWATLDEMWGNGNQSLQKLTRRRRTVIKPRECVSKQALEPEADTAARKARVAEALLQYKQQAGLVVDPQAEAAAKLAYGRGEALMQRVCSRPWGSMSALAELGCPLVCPHRMAKGVQSMRCPGATI
jgi:hypothetical protein